MGLIWTDDPKGLSTNLPMIGEPNLGSDKNRAGIIYARSIVADNIAGDTTLAFNNFLSSIDSLGTGLVNLLKGDASDNTVLNFKTGKTLRIEQDGVLQASVSTLSELILALGGITLSALGKTLTLKAGADAKAGTFTANGVTPVSVATTAFIAGSTVAISLKTVGGTVGELPHLVTATPGVGFDIAGTALDTSVYNWVIIDQA